MHTPSDFIIYITPILLGIVGYFIRQLIDKINKLEHKITELELFINTRIISIETRLDMVESANVFSSVRRKSQNR